MKSLLFITNIASPYRISFFDELGRDMDVTVLLSDEEKNHATRDAAWFSREKGNFRLVQLRRRIFAVGEFSLCADVISWLKKEFDYIVVGGYSSPTVMLAMAYMRMKGIPFYLEADGGLIRQDSPLKYRIKRCLVKAPTWWISSGPYTTEYLVHYGARQENVYEYPFTSIREADILPQPVSRERKLALRRQLQMEEEKIAVSVGQFIHRKAYDVLMQAAASLDPDTGIYIIGGEPTEEYLQMQKELGLDHVHFVGFRKKEELALFYQAADLFVLPTREDIWGLVVNEAMANGLPVVTTDRCVAGLELVENGVSGYIVPVEDADALAQRMKETLDGNCEAMGAAALERIRPYTIENMAKVHREIFAAEEN